jgi:hypothetical protein
VVDLDESGDDLAAGAIVPRHEARDGALGLDRTDDAHVDL